MSVSERKKFQRVVQRPFRWTYRDIDQALAARLVADRRIDPVVARLIAARAGELSPDGPLSEKALERFLYPALNTLHDPFLMADMEQAVGRVADALRHGQKIVIYGDYDCDGTTATALLVHLFRFLGHDVEYYIPKRLEEGYGLNRNALELLARRGTRVVLTVDNGVTAVKEAAYARELGIDLVITDHHQPGPELPDAVAVVDPTRHDCPYPFKYLAGVGVAFKFAHALLKALKVDADRGRKFLYSVVDLVAIGTVADLAPLLGENRILIRYALKQMRENPNERTQVLCNTWGVAAQELSAQTIAFSIAPRLNAAGRTDHAGVCVELFTTTSMRRGEQIALELDGFNERRKELELQILYHCQDFVEKQVDLEDEPVLVVDGDNWHIGVLGIVASRLTDQFYRPAIVISKSDGIGHGSGRSSDTFNLHQALEACAGYLLEFGGHAHAAGLRLKAHSIAPFRQSINEYAHSVLDPKELVPRLTIDTELEPAELTLGLLDALAALEPFGEGNPEPLLTMSQLRLAEPPRVVGTNHLRLRLQCDGGRFEAIGFGMAQVATELAERKYEPIAVAFSPMRNTFKGITTVQMAVKDLRFVEG
jgi:single-stranded-DNA-specific exonuclease